jgi:hypothetical protein
VRGWALFLLGLTALAGAARADGDDAPKGAADPFFRLDTKNLFGALEGADVGDLGDRSIEFENTEALFKRAGRYVFVEQEMIYEMTATPRLGIEFGAHVYGQSIRGQSDIANYSGVDFAGLSNEWRYVLAPRSGPWSAQATFTVTPQWARLFEGGVRGQDFSLPFLFIVDAQPIARRLYADLNLSWTPEYARQDGQAWTRASSLAASGAMSWRFTPAAMLGAETDIINTFDGFAAQRWQGSALFVGPTFHYQFNDKVDLSGAWTQQIAGGARGDGASLDLAHFSRSAAKLRLEVEF